MKSTMSGLLSRLRQLFTADRPKGSHPGHPATIWRIAPTVKPPGNDSRSGIDDDTEFVRIYPSRRRR